MHKERPSYWTLFALIGILLSALFIGTPLNRLWSNNPGNNEPSVGELESFLFISQDKNQRYQWTLYSPLSTTVTKLPSLGSKNSSSPIGVVPIGKKIHQVVITTNRRKSPSLQLIKNDKEVFQSILSLKGKETSLVALGDLRNEGLLEALYVEKKKKKGTLQWYLLHSGLSQQQKRISSFVFGKRNDTLVSYQPWKKRAIVGVIRNFPRGKRVPQLFTCTLFCKAPKRMRLSFFPSEEFTGRPILLRDKKQRFMVAVMNRANTQIFVTGSSTRYNRILSLPSEGSVVVGRFLSQNEEVLAHVDRKNGAYTLYHPVTGKVITQGVAEGEGELVSPRMLTLGVVPVDGKKRTPVPSIAPSFSSTLFPSPSPTSTVLSTVIPTITATVSSPPTLSPTELPSPTSITTPTASPTVTVTVTPSRTTTPTLPSTPTGTPILTATSTRIATATTGVSLPTPLPPSPTPSRTPVPSSTPPLSLSPTPTRTSTPTASPPSTSWTITHPVYTPNTAIDVTLVSSYLTMTTDQIRAQITTEGGFGTNITMRKAAYDLSRAYQKTKDSRYADKVVLILERFAEVLSQWPYIKANNVTVPRTAISWAWNDIGLWSDSDWIPLEPTGPFMDLLLAYDNIAGSGALEQRGPTVKEVIENNLLKAMMDFHLTFLNGRPDTSNVAGYRLEGLIAFGKVVDPAYIHQAVTWIQDVVKFGYYRDGMFHEGSPAYHEQITSRVARKAGRFKELYGYSDPINYRHPLTGIRYDSLNPESGMESYFARPREALRWMTLPNGKLLANHDSTSWLTAAYTQSLVGESGCLFGVKHCVHGAFDGATDQVQVHLDFSGTENHEHYDMLNLTLFAKGRELLSEGEYREEFGSPRDWNMATAQHNTVVVNEKNQEGRFDQRFSLTTDDLPDKKAQYVFWQDYGQGNTNNAGHLLLWNASNPTVSVVEVEGKLAYDKIVPMTMYRRLLATVKTTEKDIYVIDVFRLKGGSTYDWMLHGDLSTNYSVNLSTLLLSPVSQTRYQYLTVKQQGVSSADWESTITTPDGKNLRTMMLGAPATEVSVGDAPATRRTGSAKYLDVRREGAETVYVTLHEPYTTTSKVKNFRAISYTSTSATTPLYLVVELSDGRKDHIGITVDGNSSALNLSPGTGFFFSGRYAQASEYNGSVRSLFGAEAATVSFNNLVRTTTASYKGTVTDVQRKENGSIANAFVTQTPLPLGTSLAGQALLLSLPQNSVEGYTIERVDQKPDGYWIQVKEEPGIELREKDSTRGQLVKYLQYPIQGKRGSLSFTISTSLSYSSSSP